MATMPCRTKENYVSETSSSPTKRARSERTLRLLIAGIVYMLGIAVCFGCGTYLVTHEQVELGKQMIDFGKGFAGWGAFVIIFFIL